MKITLYEHPFAPVAPREFEAASLAEWLLAHYGDTPQVAIQIFAGEPSAATEITGDVRAIMSASAPRYIVLQSPGQTFLISLAVSLVLSVASAVLFPPPEMPGNVNRTQQSPNNALGARENQVRLLQRVEDIYGTVRAIPSLMMITYNKYINHQRVEVGYYCVGRGYHEISDIKDGETFLSAITGASAAVYNPFTSPNNSSPAIQIGPSIVDKIVTVRRAIEVDGITLKARNQVQLQDVSQYIFVPGGFSGTITTPGGGPITLPPSANDRIVQGLVNPAFDVVIDTDHQLELTVPTTFTGGGTVNMTVDGDADRFLFTPTSLFDGVQVGDSIQTSGFGFLSPNNGTFEITDIGPGYIEVDSNLTDVEDPTPIIVGITMFRSGYSGVRDVAAVDTRIVVLEGATFPGLLGDLFPVLASVQIVGISEWTDWVTLPYTDTTEVWWNTVAANGLYADAGSGKEQATVFFEAQIEALDGGLNPTGNVETIPGFMTGMTSDERAVTTEHVIAIPGPSRFRMRRTSPYLYDFGGTIVDEIKWSDLYAISPVNRDHFGNKTTIHTVTVATPRATAARQRQLNCIATRLLPTFNGADFSGGFEASGALAWGTIHPTRKIIDIITAVSIDPVIGRRDIAELDLAQMWAVQESLDAWHAECGSFSYTFDSDTTRLEEMLSIIANAAFCVTYRQNGRIRLAFDRWQDANTALFTHRNKRPDGERVTRTFANDADFDGVELVYQDPETLRAETIRLPLDGNYTKLKKLEIPGIRSFAQAWYRACREYQRLRYQRLSTELEVTTDARMLLPNARIAIVDNTVFRALDGEVLGQQGMELILSRDVVFEPGQPHSIVLMRRDGSLESIVVTAGSEANRVVLQSLPGGPLVTREGVEGIRTVFSFAADNAREAQAWLVQEIGTPGEDGYLPLRAINYSHLYYASDADPVPPKESVIL